MKSTTEATIDERHVFGFCEIVLPSYVMGSIGFFKRVKVRTFGKAVFNANTAFWIIIIIMSSSCSALEFSNKITRKIFFGAICGIVCSRAYPTTYVLKSNRNINPNHSVIFCCQRLCGRRIEQRLNPKPKHPKPPKVTNKERSATGRGIISQLNCHVGTLGYE